MARGKTNRGQDSGATQQVISTAVGAAEALTVGVVHLAERTLVEALHAAEDVGSEIGSTLVRAARGSIHAASDIGGDLVQVGRTVSRGIAEPARELGSGLKRMTDGLRRTPSSESSVRKPLAKARVQRRRRRAA
ncbi:MAG TPA: hypothetical protein VGL14_06040 [Methylomirabilota bacterium]|jgi:hypothetical protein